MSNRTKQFRSDTARERRHAFIELMVVDLFSEISLLLNLDSIRFLIDLSNPVVAD